MCLADCDKRGLGCTAMAFSSNKSRRLAIALLVVVVAAFLSTLVDVMGDPPFDAPKSIHSGSPRPVVVALGDSLTHGVLSHNWMRDLREHYFRRIKFVNTARCGHTSHAVLATARALKLHKPPELAIILVGTNDALAALSAGSRSFYTKLGSLPADAPASLRGALAAYERNLDQLVTHARKGLGAKRVLVISPPPLGNGKSAPTLPTGSIWGEFEHQPNDVVKQVARRAAIVAWRRRTEYLDLHAELSKRMAKEPEDPSLYFNATPGQMAVQIPRGVAVQWVPGMTFNRLSSTAYLHDHIHLNGRSAQIIFDAVEALIHRAGILS